MALLFVVTLVLVRLAYVFCVERASLSAFTCIHLFRIGHGGDESVIIIRHGGDVSIQFKVCEA